MPSIGGTTCTFIHTAQGRVPAVLAQETEIWRMAGVNGYGGHKLGLGAGEFQITATLFTNAAGVTVWETALRAKQGTVVTIVDDLGTSHGNCLLTYVSSARSKAARDASGVITQWAEIDVAGVKVA
jgi:hypothetical protein